MFSLRALLRSFRFAFAGVAFALKGEQNLRVHAVISVAAIVCGVAFSISRLEWCAVVLSIGLVWTAELLNTGIERLGDAVTREPNELIRHAKDAAAGGVLVASITAAAVGAIVFLPKVLAW